MSLPYFPMYPTDFEAKTSHLTLAEDGAYNRLLRICWMVPGCTMPADETWIMRRARAISEAEKEAVRAVLAEFFTIENGRYSNARLSREYATANEAHEKRKNAGSLGGKNKALKAKGIDPSNAKAMLWQPEPEPEPYIKSAKALSGRGTKTTDRFSEFWDQYPHRGGSKKGRAPSEVKYRAAVKGGATEAEIIAGALRYANDAQVIRGYAKDPSTWLNQKGWTDEVEPTNTVGRTAARRQDGPDPVLANILRLARLRPASGNGGA